MTMELKEIDKKLRQLRRETSGLEGAVLRAATLHALEATQRTPRRRGRKEYFKI